MLCQAVSDPGAEPSVRRELLAGAQATLPMLLGATPLAIVFGSLATSSGLSGWGAVAMSVFVYAGSAQLIAAGLLGAGVSVPLIIATTFVVNLRHMLYSANLVPKVEHLPQRWRAVMAFGLTDETFASVSGRYEQGSKEGAHYFYIGSWLAMYLNWIGWTLVGVLLGEVIPGMQSWGLDIAMYVTFIGIIRAYLKSRAMWVATLTAGALALLAHGLPNNLGLLVAAFGGIAAGMLSSRSEVKDG